MSRSFDKFQDIIDWRNKCPICSKDLVYKVTTEIFQNATKLSLSDKISKYFDGKFNPFGATDIKKVSFEFKPNETSTVEVKELDAILNLKDNTGYVKDFDVAMSGFDFTVCCPHDVIGNEYEAKGSLDFAFSPDFSDSSQIPTIDGRMIFEFDQIRVSWEMFKIYNIHLEDEKPNGNFIKILNDYHNQKTSFCMAETNLDGTLGTWKEKRLDMVNDDFFKFNNSEKIYSRINTIFLLK